MDSSKTPSEALLDLRRRNKNIIFLFLFFFFSLFLFSCSFVIYVFLQTAPSSFSHQYPNNALNVSLSTAATHLNTTMDSISLLLLHNHHSIPDLNNCHNLLHQALTQIRYSLEEDDQSEAQMRKIVAAKGAVKACWDDMENVESSEVKTKVVRAYWSVKSSADLAAAMIGDVKNWQKMRNVEWGKMIKEGDAVPFLLCLVELQFIFFGFMFWIVCRFRWPFRK